ncbi:cytochrome b [Methylobacterium sp. D54C]|jgi:cytochrome b561
MTGSLPAPGEASPPPQGGRLSLPTRLLHWSVASAILPMLAYGFWLRAVPEGPGRGTAIRLHKSLGMLLLLLVLARLLWRAWEGWPAPSSQHRSWEVWAARAMHGALLAAILLMPLSGIARSLAYPRALALFEWPLIPKLFETRPELIYQTAVWVHDGLGLALPGLIALHVAAALKHHVLDRDDTLRRMAEIGR